MMPRMKPAKSAPAEPAPWANPFVEHRNAEMPTARDQHLLIEIAEPKSL
jgi:hypothetical protein